MMSDINFSLDDVRKVLKKTGPHKDPQGYVLIRYPRGTHGKYVRRSRRVMEVLLERPLTETEIVIHLNNKRDDDRPGNLKLFASRGEFNTWRKEQVKLGLWPPTQVRSGGKQVVAKPCNGFR